MPAVTSDVAIHILFQFFAWVIDDDARLKCAGVGIERRRDVGDFAVEGVGISVGFDNDIVAIVDKLEVGLIDVGQDPDGAEIGDSEGLRLPGLHHLSGETRRSTTSPLMGPGREFPPKKGPSQDRRDC